MKKEELKVFGSSGVQLPGVIWQPEGETKALLQIAHGMTEHMGRYERFASALCSRGIAVAGFDLRGHGKNPGDKEVASCGEGGWTASVEDMKDAQIHPENHQNLIVRVGGFSINFIELDTEHQNEIISRYA